MSYMSYGEATKVSLEMANEPCEKRATIQETVDALTVDLTRLAQVLNALCGHMAGADTENIQEAPNGPIPILMRLGELTERTRYCLERAETLIKIMGQ